MPGCGGPQPYTSPIMAACSDCGAENAAEARFCQRCGSLLPTESGPGATSARKIVTILFVDVVGFTELGERMDPEIVRGVMARYFATARAAVQRHGGFVEKFVGDAVVGIFGIPQLHEDDAVRAVRAASELGVAIADLNEELRAAHGVAIEIRTGINTGEVMTSPPTSTTSGILGDAVNVASRLEQAAGAGEILLGEATHRMTRGVAVVDPVEPLALKGKALPVTAYRLVAVAEPTAPPWRMDSPIVARGSELALLGRAFRRAVDDRAAIRFVLVGPAGIGKSRLATEFAAGLGDRAVVLQGRCLAYGEGITFWPARAIVKQACGIVDTDTRDGVRAKILDALPADGEAGVVADSLEELLGLSGGRAGMRETFRALRRLLEHLASARPVVIVFDDVHWAEPAFLDLVEYLVGWSEGAPILCLCLGRPELLETRAGWRQRTEREWSATLQPLSPSESDLLLANLLARGKLADAARARIVEAAEGNPLFVEEMLRMLVDENLLRQESGQWTSVRDLSDLAVPPTINALIGARVDRLSAGEQSVTQRASVVGKVFWWGAVSHMSPVEERPAVGGHLQTLVRKELIQPDRSVVEGEDAFRFHHLLIRDTVYQGTPKARRADLHELFAEWLERVVGERLAEYEEVVGYHLEQAAEYLAELEPAAPRSMDLAARAAARLAPAGRRAFAHGDMRAAANLLGRARALLPAEDALRRELLPDLAEAFSEEGELAAAAAVLDEAASRAAEAGDARTEAHATIVRMLLAESTEPEGRSDVALKELERIIPIFEQLGDDLGLARSHRLVADVHWTSARYASCTTALLQGLEHARRAGAVREETECLGQLAGAYLYGPTPVDEVVRRCDEILADPGARPAAEARALRTLASCRAMQGRFDEARELVRRSRRMLNELGLHLRAAFTSEAAGFVEMLAGDAAAAEAEFRGGFEAAEELGELGYRATAAGLLSQAVFAQGRLDEAAALAGTAEEATAADDLTTQILWRGVRGRVLSARGDHVEAEALEREAAALAAETDDVNMRADTLVDLAHVLRAAGRDAEADGEVGRALDLYEGKGNEVAAARTRSLIATWASADAS